MTANDLRPFSVMLANLSDLYGKTLSHALGKWYWQSLKRFTLAQVQHACQVHCEHPEYGRFFPKPADIIRVIDGNPDDQALRAWSLVEQTIRQVGAYTSVAFDDPIIHAVIRDMSGWIRLCATTINELPFRSQEFQKRYQGYVIQRPTQYPPYLRGITEHHNQSSDHRAPTPLLIGDPNKAKALVLSGCSTPLPVQSFTTAPLDACVDGQDRTPSTGKENDPTQ